MKLNDSKFRSIKNLFARELIDQFYPFISQDIKNELYYYTLDNFNQMNYEDVIKTIENHYTSKWIEVNTND